MNTKKIILGAAIVGLVAANALNADAKGKKAEKKPPAGDFECKLNGCKSPSGCEGKSIMTTEGYCKELQAKMNKNHHKAEEHKD